MLGQVGSILIGLALAAVIYAAVAVLLSISSDDRRWAASGYRAVYAATALLGVALLLLLYAFLADQFQLRYVAHNSSRAIPLYLKVSALWAGQEGSLLLWSFLQALFAALVIARPSSQSRSLVPWATVILSLITSFFIAVTLFLSDPFSQTALMPADGQGLNPLLRHPGMIFHPPAMYLGYVGLAVPFAFALASLLTHRVADWTVAARRWTLVSWLFLGLGLLLGMRWAYDVLGWGGYWGWDPVENAGLMPWLAATALLHSAVMQDEKRGFRGWSMALVVLSFVLVLFGTFATRSGMIQSVHAYARSGIGNYFLAAIVVALLGALALLYAHRRQLADSHRMDDLLSRQGLFVLTLILFLTLTASVFIGSVLPTLTDAFAAHQFEAGPEWFDRVTGPQFAGLLLVLGFCPLLGRAAQTAKRLRRHAWSLLAGTVVVPAVAALAGFTDWVSLLGLALVGLAGGTAVAEMWRDTAARSRRAQEDLWHAFWHQAARNRRRYGGYVVHIGVVLIAVGVIGTRLYPFETEVVISPGEMRDVGEYTMVFEDLHQEEAGDYFATWASLSLYKNGRYVTTLQPRLNQYPRADEQTLSVPALRPTMQEDFYVVLAGFDRSSATFKVFINSLASFLWLGGMFFMAGGLLALWPATQTAHLSARWLRRQRLWNNVALLLAAALFVLAGLAMWGPGHGTAQQGGRPLPGQQAPNLNLTLLDGSTLTLDDLRGRAVVINFWATWCPSCEDELPDLQAVQETYPNVAVVGVAYDDSEAAVRQRVAALGLTYFIGLDEGERIATAYGVTGVPETFVLDGEGRVVNVYIGAVSEAGLVAQLDALLGR